MISSVTWWLWQDDVTGGDFGAKNDRLLTLPAVGRCAGIFDSGLSASPCAGGQEANVKWNRRGGRQEGWCELLGSGQIALGGKTLISGCRFVARRYGELRRACKA